MTPGFFTWTLVILTTYSLKKTERICSSIGYIVNEAPEKNSCRTMADNMGGV